MRNWRTQGGYFIYRVLSGRSNAYLITSPNGNLLVDTGKRSDFEKLLRSIDQIFPTPPKVDFLILTHTHYDHCRNAYALKKKEQCQIIVSEKAKRSIQKGYTRLPRGTTPITDLISRAGLIIGRKRFGYPVFVPDILVEGELDLRNNGLNIKIIQTPGHSMDSISVTVDSRIAIVGDAMFGMFKNSITPPYADDHRQMIRSWGKLLETGCEVFLPGHGKEIKRELLLRKYRKYGTNLV